MKLVPDRIAQGPIEFGSADVPALPNRVDQLMYMTPGIFDFRCWYTAQGFRPVPGLVVAADIITASIAAPEGQVMQVWSVRVDLGAIGQSSIDVGTAATTKYPHRCYPSPASVTVLGWS
jgi:hypothetical protein